MSILDDRPDGAGEPDADRVRVLLAERAGSVRPRPVPVGQVVRRARRVRRARTSVAVGAGLTAAAAVGAVVVVDRSPDRLGDVATGPADATTSTSSSAASSATPGGLTFAPVPADAFPAASGPPLRMGLAVPGAIVTSATDIPAADQAADPPPGVAVDFADAGGVRRLWVSAIFDLPDQPPAPEPSGPGITVVDLGAGVQGSLHTVPVPLAGPDGVAEALELTFRVGPHSIHLLGIGLTEDEVVAVGLGATIVDGPVLALDGVPHDLVPGEPRNPWAGDGSGGVRSQVVYRLADGSDAVVDVVSRPGSAVAQAIDAVRAAPTAEVFLRPVRGRDAIVRRLPGFGPAGGEVVTVTWYEPSGNLVTVRLEPADAGAADPSVVDGVVELDEASFQSLLADPGPG